jgi:hypothetical protein
LLSSFSSRRSFSSLSIPFRAASITGWGFYLDFLHEITVIALISSSSGRANDLAFMIGSRLAGDEYHPSLLRNVD